MDTGEQGQTFLLLTLFFQKQRKGEGRELLLHPARIISYLDLNFAHAFRGLFIKTGKDKPEHPEMLIKSDTPAADCTSAAPDSTLLHPSIPNIPLHQGVPFL